LAETPAALRYVAERTVLQKGVTMCLKWHALVEIAVMVVIEADAQLPRQSRGSITTA